MLGAIIGDIIGSRFEFDNTNNYDFTLFAADSDYTDDTICTVAIADTLLNGSKDYKAYLLKWCRKYPHPKGAYGGSFSAWLHSSDPQPYNSFGNGSAMRVSAIGWYFDTLEEVQFEAGNSALPTHNHLEGVKGAVATATAIFLARTQGKEAMLEVIKEHYYPAWVEPQLGKNRFDETCQGTMPVVFGIIDKANGFEEAIRYAIAVGGDSDTIGAIVGSIAEAIWGIPQPIADDALNKLPRDMKNVLIKFSLHAGVNTLL